MSDDTLRIAAEVVTEGPRHGSPSRIMRQLRQDHGIAVSFNEALDLLSRLEAAGVVGPMDMRRCCHPVLLDREQALGAVGDQ